MSGERKDDVELEAMRAQDRIDQKWLEAREQGLAELPPISEQRAEEYLAMERALAELPEHQAPLGWNAAVLAEAERLDAAEPFGTPFDASARSAEDERVEIAAQRTRTLIADGSHPRILFEGARSFEAARLRHGRLLAVAGVAALAAAFCIWLATSERRPAAPVRPASALRASPLSAESAQVAMAQELGELSTRVLPATSRRVSPGEMAQPIAVRRSGSRIAIGDTFVAQLVVTSGRRGELRLYRKDGDVVARCSSEDLACATPDGTGKVALRLHVEIDTAGAHRVVYLEGEDIAAPSGDLNRDLEMCNSCRTRIEPPETVE